MINKPDRPASLVGLLGRRRSPRVRRRTSKRGAKKFLTLTAVVGLVFTGLPTAIAQAAAPRFSDGFEGNPAQRWEPLTSGDGRAGFDLAQGLARSGADNGWLYAGQGWAAERIAVPVGDWPERSSCVAEIYAQPVGGGGAQVALEIWDPNGWHKLTSTAPFSRAPATSASGPAGSTCAGWTRSTSRRSSARTTEPSSSSAWTTSACSAPDGARQPGRRQLQRPSMQSSLVVRRGSGALIDTLPPHCW
ncbi:hypothetical protein GCM10009850_080390 [Nonomuraea monospora]|uniref:Uncharacterized protein n=1 Tax=Nonomuraea monospora TaxID=568818 RepID=A0ABN3CT69_9ACTN